MNIEEGKNIYEVCSKLLEKDITLDEIANTYELNFLIQHFDKKFAFKKASQRAEKWIRKKQRYLDKNTPDEVKEAMRDKMFTYQYFRSLQDSSLKRFLGHMGLSPGEKLAYLRFSYSLAKKLKKADPSSWVSIIEEMIELWSHRKGFDKKLLKAVALLTAKLSFAYLTREHVVIYEPTEAEKMIEELEERTFKMY